MDYHQPYPHFINMIPAQPTGHHQYNPYCTFKPFSSQTTGQVHPSSLGYEGHFERVLKLPRDYLNYNYSYPGGIPYDKVLQRAKLEQIERDRCLKHHKLQEIRNQRPSWQCEEQEDPYMPGVRYCHLVPKSADYLHTLRMKYDVKPGTPYWQAAGAMQNRVGVWDINQSARHEEPDYYDARDFLLDQKPMPGTDTYLFRRQIIMPKDNDSVDWRVAEEELETSIKFCVVGDLQMNENARNHLIFIYTRIADLKKKLAEHEFMLEESELDAKNIQSCLEHSEWEFYEMWRDRDELEKERNDARTERDQLEVDRDHLEVECGFLKKENDDLKRKLKKYERMFELLNPKDTQED